MNGSPCRHIRDRRYRQGFTLVELLVAEVVFLVLMFIVVQLIFSVLGTAGAQKKQMDMLDDARQSLDRLSLDWSARVRRSDVLGDFTHQAASGSGAGNAQISFLTQVQAYSGARHLSWVTYQVGNVPQVNQGSQNITAPALERSIIGYNFSATDPSAGNPLLVFPAGSGAPAGTPTVEPLASTVFRFDYCFLQQAPATVPPATTTSAFTINPALSLASSSLEGVVVSVAALDQQSRQILSQSQLIQLGNALPAVPDGESPQAVWTTSINNGTFRQAAAAAGIPASAAAAVCVFQRILYVNE
jgi:prepilin-type N-terminal cleavage/methylation domain-containing protein